MEILLQTAVHYLNPFNSSAWASYKNTEFYCKCKHQLDTITLHFSPGSYYILDFSTVMKHIYEIQLLLPLQERAQNLPVCKSLSTTATPDSKVFSRMAWLCYGPTLTFWFMCINRCALEVRVCHMMKIKCYKSPY